MYSTLSEHRDYLADHARLQAFEQAINEVTRPGDVVVDLGAGTGILGQLACRAGARRVYAIEAGSVLEIAREIARANGTDDRMVFLKGLSTDVTLPEPADVVMADQIGYFGIGAGLLDYFADARRRLLKPGGRLMPSHLDLWVAAVDYPEAERLIGLWQSKPAGVDVSPVHDLAANTAYPVTMSAHHLLTPPAPAASLSPGQDDPVLRAAVHLKTTRGGHCHGLVGFFTVRLSPTVTMSNDPRSTDRIARDQLFLPLPHPVPVKEDAPVTVVMTIRPADATMGWDVTLRTGSGQATFRQSTFRGTVLAREDLAVMRPDAMPRLTERGQAARTVLDLCDGRRSVADLEAMARAGAPGLFRSAAEAQAFVTAVLQHSAR